MKKLLRVILSVAFVMVACLMFKPSVAEAHTVKIDVNANVQVEIQTELRNNNTDTWYWMRLTKCNIPDNQHLFIGFHPVKDGRMPQTGYGPWLFAQRIHKNDRGWKLSAGGANAASASAAGLQNWDNCSYQLAIYSQEWCSKDRFVQDKAEDCDHANSGHYVCNNCGGSSYYASSTKKALGHTWNGGQVTKYPTVYEDGVMTYTCNRNHSHTYTKTIKNYEFKIYIGDKQVQGIYLGDIPIRELFIGSTSLITNQIQLR